MRSSNTFNIASSCSENVNPDNRSRGLVKGKGTGSARPTNAQVIRHQARSSSESVIPSMMKLVMTTLKSFHHLILFINNLPCNGLHPLVGDGLKTFGWEPGAILHLEYLPNNVKYVAQVIRYATYNCVNY